jgi:hypothetical protein
MAIRSFTLPAVTKDYGYSCQCWLKTQIDRLCYSPPWIWFSTAFGAWTNVDSSNPCWLYLDLSRAVYQKDVGNRLIRDLRAQMLRSVDNSSLSPGDKHNLRTRVTTAAIDEFRPEVWRLDLNKIAFNRRQLLNNLMAHLQNNAQGQIAPPQVLQRDEYLITDLQPSSLNIEYFVIIEG